MNRDEVILAVVKVLRAGGVAYTEKVARTYDRIAKAPSGYVPVAKAGGPGRRIASEFIRLGVVELTQVASLPVYRMKRAA